MLRCSFYARPSEPDFLADIAADMQQSVTKSDL